jgi:hypothetical protein
MPADVLLEITSTNRWRAVAESIVLGGQPLPVSTDDFATYWIVAGHQMREQIEDDRLLCNLLRRVLPRYLGDTITLYRGENLDRWRTGTIGFAWTPSIETARMFARGLNAISAGGVLLFGTFEPCSIISGPNSHSNYLQEDQFTIDPFLTKDIQRLETYPPL